MKKFICLIIVLLALAPTVFAGDVPEALLYEDDAKVFIGTVESYKKDYFSYPESIVTDLEIIPTEKIKGDVQIGIKETYKRCYSSLGLNPNTEYLFGYFDDNNFYIYEIEYKDDKRIRLVGSKDNDMTGRLEDYLNDGTFALAEQKRTTKTENYTSIQEMESIPKKNYTVWIFVGIAFIVFAIAFLIGYIKHKRLNG